MITKGRLLEMINKGRLLEMINKQKVEEGVFDMFKKTNIGSELGHVKIFLQKLKGVSPDGNSSYLNNIQKVVNKLYQIISNNENIELMVQLAELDQMYQDLRTLTKKFWDASRSQNIPAGEYDTYQKVKDGLVVIGNYIKSHGEAEEDYDL